MKKYAKKAAGRVFSYLVRTGDALSQLANVVLFFGANPNESISGRCWRLSHQKGWRQFGIAIDWIFSWWHPNHCQQAYHGDLRRARALIRENELKRYDMA